jgi:hypothetical protein
MRAWILLPVLLATLTACDSAQPAGTSGPSVDSACLALAKARCALLDTCTSGIGSQVTYGSVDNCQSRQLLGCQLNLAAPGQSQTASTVQACADVAATQSCWDRTLNVQPEACVPLPGALTEGQACIAAGQCASTWCAVQNNAVVGVCAPLPKVGDNCETTSCGRGLACAKNSAGVSVCFAPLAIGGACDKEHHCGPELACVGATKTAQGTCQAKGAAVGVACDAKDQTAPDCVTVRGLFCDSTGHCQAVSVAKATEVCGATGTDAGAACGSAGLCVKAAATDKSGLCKAAAEDGAPCDSDPSKGPDCMLPAKCVATTSGGTAGVCTLPHAP